MSQNRKIETMSDFFNNRADIYDDHMIKELDLNVFYDEIAECIPKNRTNIKLLDLGCGTGLELERIFRIYPLAVVTGVDLSSKMLDILKAKYKDKMSQLKLICQSYFDIDYGNGVYDVVLSTYSLHHFSRELKLSLYRKIYSSLKEDGIYIEGDYTAKTTDEENRFIVESERIRKAGGITDGLYHIDIPFTAETQMNLLRQAGFKRADIKKQWDKTTIFVCEKNLKNVNIHAIRI
ncbi:MAG TPA: class I SAM-dependent methyltransferase [Ruminiclostridium sp.]|nr:class I SAM-dependent methyltransferase [Clostridiaceae bacterium]HAA25765.1 class I SAM-dependent methyltransferase [Ruminiclostridium sp.]